MIGGLIAYWFAWLSLSYSSIFYPSVTTDSKACPYYVTTRYSTAGAPPCGECPPGTEPVRGFCRNYCPQNYTRVTLSTCVKFTEIRTDEPAPSVDRAEDALCPDDYPTTAPDYRLKCFTACPEGFLRTTPQSCVKFHDTIMKPEFVIAKCKLDNTSPHFVETNDEPEFVVNQLAEECREKGKEAKNLSD